MPTQNVKSVKKIHSHFKAFRKKLRHTWEEYSFIHFYAPIMHEKIKLGELPPYEFVPFLAAETDVRTNSINRTLGALDQVLKNSLDHRVLLDSIGAFEDYICKLAEVVYIDFPGKLKSQSPDTERDDKLINLIIDSNDKEEIISKIIEEKLRSLFYGNPIHIFEKDKAKLEINNHFKDNYCNILVEYAEIVARRNIIVHNSGRVDRKYLREVKGTSLKLGNKVQLDSNYLRRALGILEGIAAETSDCAVKKLYKDTSDGKLKLSLESFRKGVGGGHV